MCVLLWLEYFPLKSCNLVSCSHWDSNQAGSETVRSVRGQRQREDRGGERGEATMGWCGLMELLDVYWARERAEAGGWVWLEHKNIRFMSWLPKWRQTWTSRPESVCLWQQSVCRTTEELRNKNCTTASSAGGRSVLANRTQQQERQKRFVATTSKHKATFGSGHLTHPDVHLHIIINNTQSACSLIIIIMIRIGCYFECCFGNNNEDSSRI